MIESIDTLALFHGQKNVETTVRYLKNRSIQSMHRLTLIQGEKIVETTARFSSKKTIKSWIDWL